MKKIIILAIILVLPVMALSQSASFGVGASGGLFIPVVQDDQGSGTIFNLRGIWNVSSLFSVEPHLNLAKYGDPSSDGGVFDGFEGSKVTSFGVNAVLGMGGGMGLHPLIFAGIGSYKTKRDLTSQDVSDIGYSGGLGIEIGINKSLAVDARGAMYVIPLDEGGSKKSVSVTGGVNFYFGQ